MRTVDLAYAEGTMDRGLSEPSLAQFLRSHRDDILARWTKAARRQPQAGALTGPELIDRIPELLDAVAAAAESPRPEGDALVSLSAAEQHGLDRLSQGVDLGEVVAELAILRDAVHQVRAEVGPPEGSHSETRFFDRSMDQAIIASLNRYTEARERTSRALDRISTVALQAYGGRLETFLESLLRVIVDTTPSIDTGAIFLREGDELVVRAAAGLEEDIVGFRLRIGEGFAGRIAAEHRAAMIDASRVAEVVRSPVLRASGVKCLYGIPLNEDSTLIGVTYIGTASAACFSDQDKQLFTAMAARAASGIVLHQARALSERTAAELTATVQSIPEAVLMGNAKGLHTANRAALELLEVGSVEEIDGTGDLGATFELRLPSTGETLPLERRPFRRALRGEVVAEELWLRNLKTSRDLLVRIAAAPVQVDKRTVAAVLIISDVTALRRDERERRQLYEQAQQAISDRDRLLAIVSHDLRNPLNSIVMGSAVIKDSCTEEGTAKTGEMILRNARRMDRLIGNLLDVSSIQAGRFSVTKAPIDVTSVVDEAIESVRAEAELRGLDLRNEVKPLRIVADRDRVLQALGNLLGNAVKATRTGSVSVQVTETNHDAALFSVIDTGPGIPEGTRESLFEPYSRGQDPGYRGTGLGLAITRGIVEAHGGKIWVETEANKGTAFRFTIPLASERSAPDPGRPGNSAASGAR